MSKSQGGLLTLGAGIIIIAIVILLGAMAVITWWEVIPLVVALYGVWLIVSAGLTARTPSKYGWSAFSLFGWGMLLAAIGFGMDFYYRGLDIVYVLVVVLLLLGILAVVAALKTTRKTA